MQFSSRQINSLGIAVQGTNSMLLDYKNLGKRVIKVKFCNSNAVSLQNVLGIAVQENKLFGVGLYN